MVRINKFSTIQSTNVQGTEQAQPAATNQPQSEAVNTSAPSANSANTWQRASLAQDGIAQQTKLAQSYDRPKAEIAQAKAAREDRDSGSLIGTIFAGPIIGTVIGKAIDTSSSNTEANQSPLRDLLETTEEELKKLQEQLKEVQDNSFIETVGGFFGHDAGQSDVAQATNQNPVKDLPIEAYTKVQHDPDDD